MITYREDAYDNVGRILSFDMGHPENLTGDVGQRILILIQDVQFNILKEWETLQKPSRELLDMTDKLKESIWKRN